MYALNFSSISVDCTNIIPSIYIYLALRFRPKQRQKYSEVLPWAISVGTNAKFLPGVYYEQRWDQKIDDFRAEMRIPDIPKLLK